MASHMDRVVVIGAGMGGLAAALRLSHAGFDVTLVEEGTPGGKMRTLPSVAGPVDAGPTVLTLKAVFDDLFAAAGTSLEAHLTLEPLPVLARHWWPDGSTLDLLADEQASGAAVRAFAGPKAEAEFHRFSRRAAALFTAFDAPVMQRARPHLGGILAATLRSPQILPWLLPGLTLSRALSASFTDPRLRQLFGRYATYVGGAPARSPAVLALIWQAEARGVWAVKGGMARLAATLTRLVEAAGATLVTGVAVRDITVSAGRVAGVTLADGRSLSCAHVVHAGDPAALAEGLLGPDARRAVPQRAVQPRSHSAEVWAFAARPQGLPLAYHNVFFAADPRAEFDRIARGLTPDDPTLYVCAQDRALCPPAGPERSEIILNAPALPKDTAAPPDEMDLSRCRNRTFQTLSRFGLTFDTPPGASALTGPTGFARMFRASQGSLYGISPHGLTATFRRPGARTVIAGLYLAGGGVHPGAGIPMAALSGRHAAGAIMQDRALTRPWARTAMPGGMSTASATTDAMPSRSSPS
ncbi:MAG: phytoene desaturase [Rhodobacter sp.]|nr:phytoene desaturase [Rhodobacter sp.]